MLPKNSSTSRKFKINARFAEASLFCEPGNMVNSTDAAHIRNASSLAPKNDRTVGRHFASLIFNTERNAQASAKRNDAAENQSAISADRPARQRKGLLWPPCLQGPPRRKRPLDIFPSPAYNSTELNSRGAGASRLRIRVMPRESLIPDPGNAGVGSEKLDFPCRAAHLAARRFFSPSGLFSKKQNGRTKQ